MQLFVDRAITAEDLADVYQRSGINRPVDDLPRMRRLAEVGFKPAPHAWFIPRVD